MTADYQENQHHDNTAMGVLAGMLVGALAGAVTVLLMAPQSGAATRMQIQEKGIELRDRATSAVEDTIAQVRMDGSRLSSDGRAKVRELLHQGQALAVEQLDHVSDAAQAGKKALQSN